MLGELIMFPSKILRTSWVAHPLYQAGLFSCVHLEDSQHTAILSEAKSTISSSKPIPILQKCYLILYMYGILLLPFDNIWTFLVEYGGKPTYKKLNCPAIFPVANNPENRSMRYAASMIVRNPRGRRRICFVGSILGMISTVLCYDKV